MRHLMHGVFIELHVVGGLNQCTELDAKLMLRWSDLMVVLFHIDTHAGHNRYHLRANVLSGVKGWHGEVAALDTRTVAHIALFIFAGTVVRTLDPVHLIHGAVHRNIDLHVLK